MTECRICLEANHEERGSLISPCKCSGSQKYIHEQCLQRWRDEHMNRANRDNCEICKTDFQIIHDHHRETCIMKLYEGPWAPPILYYLVTAGMFGVCLYQYDIYSDFVTVQIVVPNNLNQSLILLIQKDTIFRFIYYILFSSYLLSTFYLMLFGLSSICYLYRLCRYWKEYFPHFMIHYLMCYSFILILYGGIYTNSLDLFINIALVPTVLHLPILNYSHMIHNSIIDKMNHEPNNEHIISITDNIV